MNQFKWVRSKTFRFIRRVLWSNKVIRFLTKNWSDERFIRVNYWWCLNKPLNLNNPKSFTEKLQWLSIHDHSEIRMMATDKYLARNYIAEKMHKAGLPDILIPMFGVFDSVNKIDWKALPNSFVLKANHGSGWNVLVSDKSSINVHDVTRKLRGWLADNYYYRGREYQYKNITPKIICEEFLKNKDGSEVFDYKFMCFNGKPTFLWVDYNRHTKHVRNYYDLNGNPLGYESDEPADYSIKFVKPDKYELMLKIAETLAAPFKHVRVDLYNVDGKISFGELTFSSWGGFVVYRTAELDDMWGELLKL